MNLSIPAKSSLSSNEQANDWVKLPRAGSTSDWNDAPRPPSPPRSGHFNPLVVRRSSQTHLVFVKVRIAPTAAPTATPQATLAAISFVAAPNAAPMAAPMAMLMLIAAPERQFFVLLVGCCGFCGFIILCKRSMPPNDTDHRPHANRLRNETEASSRGLQFPVCWAVSLQVS